MKKFEFLLLLICSLTFAAGATAQEKKTDTAKPAEKSADAQTQSNAAPQQQAAVKNPALREELLKRMKADQQMRTELATDYTSGSPLPAEVAARFKAADDESTEWLKKAVEQYGFPGIALVGKDGSVAAFVLAQHADRDLAFQKKFLELLKNACEQKDASASTLAYLTDHILVAEGKPQKYGTQMKASGDGIVKPLPIEDEANVDKRRAEIGLSSMADFIKTIQSRTPKPKN